VYPANKGSPTEWRRASELWEGKARVGVLALGALPFSDTIESGEKDSRAVQRFASWLKGGGRYASDALGPLWQRAIATAPCVAFSYSVEAELLFGTMIPTETRGHRPCGFAVFEKRADAIVRSLSAAIPCADVSFFETCATLVWACRDDVSWDAARRRIRQGPPLCEDAHRVVANNFLHISEQQGGASTMFSALGDGPKVISALVRAIRTQQREAQGPRAIRVALHTRKPEATALVWLAVIRTAARWTDHVPTAFWTMGADRPWLQVQLREPDVETFASLWSDAPDPAHTLDLRAPISACFARPESSIGDLLTTVAAI